jgi:hypothetical protein
MGKPGLWYQGSDNSCDEVAGCKGAGTTKHIQHTLETMTLTKLMGVVLSHCGDSVSAIKSCGCSSYLEEIGRRGTPEGLTRHKKAVEAHKEYLLRVAGTLAPSSFK